MRLFYCRVPGNTKGHIMDETTSKCKFCGEKIFSPEEACPHCGKYEKGCLIITQSGWLQKFEPKEPVIGDGWYLYDHAKTSS